MALCANCGTSLAEDMAFCASCGAPVASAQPGAAPMREASLPALQSGRVPSNVAGVLAYSLGWLTGIIFLCIEPYKRNPFVRFHAFQSIFLSLFYILLIAGLGALSAALGPIFALLRLALQLAFVLLWLRLMYKAFKGERFSLPFIGPLAASRA